MISDREWLGFETNDPKLVNLFADTGECGSVVGNASINERFSSTTACAKIPKGSAALAYANFALRSTGSSCKPT
jgi:hypothetical protein